MPRLADLSIDELHTLCTALGNAVKAMEEQKARMQERGRRETADYIECCIQDAELLQREAVEALVRKNGQYKGMAPKVESKRSQAPDSASFKRPAAAAHRKLPRKGLQSHPGDDVATTGSQTVGRVSDSNGTYWRTRMRST